MRDCGRQTYTYCAKAWLLTGPVYLPILTAVAASVFPADPDRGRRTIVTRPIVARVRSLQPRVSRRRLVTGLAAMGATLLMLPGADRAEATPGRARGPDEAPSVSPAELADLLAYLGVDYAAFAPHEAAYMAALRDLLNVHDIVAMDYPLDRGNYRDAVRRFQRDRGMAEDGVPGEDVLWALQLDWQKACRFDLDGFGGDFNDWALSRSGLATPGCAGARRVRAHQLWSDS
jgi:hypothetical protein